MNIADRLYGRVHAVALICAIGCGSDAEPGSQCGNAAVEMSEACDDGNQQDGDGCSSACLAEPGFICTGQPSTCVLASPCGNAIVEMTEACDDGNQQNGDGCSSACVVEPGFICTGQPSTCVLPCNADPTCDDQNPCTDDQCSLQGVCEHTNNNAVCDDGSFCNGADTCGAGTCSVHNGDPCAGGAECANICDEANDTCNVALNTACAADSNTCTDDVCNGSGACTHPNNSAPCDDGLFCNGADTCGAGACSVHPGDPCVGGVVCANTCDETNNTCNLPVDTPCTADSSVCTDDVCDGGGVCTHPSNSAPCNDGVFCNGDDTCSGGSCSLHSGDPCVGGVTCNASCNESADNCFNAAGTACDDALFCNGNDTCNGAGTCSTHAGDPCSPASCDESGNVCAGTPHFASIATGGTHTCGLTVYGAAYCWGADTYGGLGNGGSALDTQSPSAVDTSTIPGNKAFAQLTAGLNHACGLTAEGVAYCWGADGYGQLGNGGSAVDTQSPSAIDTSTIAGNKAFVQLAAGATHTCGLTADGVAYCWGSDAFGKLGNGGASANTQSPSAVDTSTISGTKAFVQLTASNDHTCGLTADGVAYCWGDDASGGLGNGAAGSAQSPSAVDRSTISGNRAFVQLSAGNGHTCGLTADAGAYCWGWDGFGQLGNGGVSVDTQSPSAVDTSAISANPTFVRVTAGWYTTCGLTADGVAYCWGYDGSGQLGNGGGSANTQSPSAVDTSAIAGNKTVVQLIANQGQSCALTGDGVAYCWGGDNWGQLGNGGGSMNAQSPSAVEMSTVAASKGLVQVVAGGYHSCGRTAEGKAFCWGGDLHGQLGNGGTSMDAQSPSAVDTSTITGNTAFVQLTAGYEHSCGLTSDGRAFCWGYNYNGQLGSGSQDMQSPSGAGGAFVQITAGAYHTCALAVGGQAWCWGRGGLGQLGNGGTTDGYTFVGTSTITGNKAFVQLTAGASHTCGLTADGAAYCWGANGNGSLGIGSTSIYESRPVAVDTSGIAGDKRFIQLTGGWSYTCGLTSEHVSYCWGSDLSGELGNGGASVNVSKPSAVDTSTIAGNRAVIQVTAGGSRTCAVAADGVPYCWGDGTQSPSAVDVSTVGGNRAFTRVSAGAGHTCALTADGLAYCWGNDGNGQIGDGGTSTTAPTPTAVDTSLL